MSLFSGQIQLRPTPLCLSTEERSAGIFWLRLAPDAVAVVPDAAAAGAPAARSAEPAAEAAAQPSGAVAQLPEVAGAVPASPSAEPVATEARGAHPAELAVSAPPGLPASEGALPWAWMAVEPPPAS
jgi:hypothetical protein